MESTTPFSAQAVQSPVARQAGSLAQTAAAVLKIIFAPAAHQAWAAFFAMVVAGVALTPLGSRPFLPPAVASGLLFAAAIVGGIIGALFARPRFNALARGLLFSGTLMAIAGGALLDTDSSAQGRATAIASLLISAGAGLMSLHLWEEILTRARLFTTKPLLGYVFRIWHVLYSLVMATIILLPLFILGFNIAMPIYDVVRLIPIALGAAMAVALLDQSRRYPHIGRVTDAMAWLCFMAQLALLIGIIPYSLGWAAALGLVLAQFIVAVRWIAVAHLEQAVIAGRTILSLRAQVHRLREVVADDHPHQPPLDHLAEPDHPWVDLLNHDIKKAMTTVMLGASHLRNAMKDEHDPVRADFAQKVYSSSQRLSRFFGLFMDYLLRRESTAPPLTLTRVPLVATIRTVVEDERHVRPNPITFLPRPLPMSHGTSPDDATEVHWDITRIEELLINVIDNAVKYSAPKGTIQIYAWLPDDEHVALAVQDHGRGMTAEAALHAFDPGYRANGMEPGQGLGLTIVKQIAQWHGGTIDVDSTPGAGTTVLITLPREVRGE